MSPVIRQRCLRVLVQLSAMLPAVASAQTAPTLSSIMSNMTGVAHGAIGLLMGVAFLTGLTLFIVGIWQITKVAESGGRESWKKPFLTLLAAGLIFTLPATINLVSLTLSLSGAAAGSNVLAITTSAGPFAAVSGAMQGVVALIELLGNIAFFKGLYEIKQIGDGNSKHGWFGAILLMAMGAIAINVVVFAHIMGNTFAPGFQLGI